MITAMRRRMRRVASEADGFTLIELVVALAIATVIFSAMAAAGIAGVRASVVARQNQQAVDVLNEMVEQSRSVSYTSLAMVTSDLQVNDDAITHRVDTPRTRAQRHRHRGRLGADTGSVNPHVETVVTTQRDRVHHAYLRDDAPGCHTRHRGTAGPEAPDGRGDLGLLRRGTGAGHLDAADRDDPWAAASAVRRDPHLADHADPNPQQQPDLGIPGRSTAVRATPSTSLRRRAPGRTGSTPTATAIGTPARQRC